ncbi:unnamed protein product, partial [Ectocarpus fasciculatus]
QSKLYSPDSVTNDYFGFSTAVWEDTVAVGAYATVAFGSSDRDVTGSVFIYDNHDVYNTRLVIPDADESFFGYSVAIWEDTVVVGAPRASQQHCDDCGAGYVYTRYSNGSWIRDADLVAEDYIDFHYVGFDVGIYQDVIIVGAPGDKGQKANANTGAAYIFSKDASTGRWVYDQKLSIDNDQKDDKKHGAEFDHFGSAVAIFGDYAVTAAYGEEHNTGAVYVYEHQGFWSAKYKLVANDAREGIFFGYAVAIHQDIIVVGAYNGDGHWYGAGAAYVFELIGGGVGFQQTSKLVAHDGMSSDFFGFSVAIFQNVIVFEGQYSNRGTGAGAAYVFKRSGTAWGQVMKLLPSYAEAYDHFGVSVSTYNEEFIVGADTADGVVDDTGAVYVF